MLKEERQRFLSLDIFRGLTVAGMILVNNPGSWAYVYPPLGHAPWDGCTPTDLVFPFFLFAVGNALSFAIGKTENRQLVLQKIFKRTVLIFLIGLLLNWFPFVKWDGDGLIFKDLGNLRIMGVLQRIAIAYCGGALITYFFTPKTAFFMGLGLLFGYWGILISFGDLTLEGNAVRKLDLLIFTENHLYKGYESKILGTNIAFDPEGLLSCIPAIASVIFGFLAGKFIQTFGKTNFMLRRFILAGIILIFSGLIWNFVFPINKPIWSGSYVFYTTGWAMLLLSVIFYVVEMLKIDGWAEFFLVFGRNPLFIFVLSGVWVKLYALVRIGEAKVGFYGWFYKTVFQPLLGNYPGSLAFAVFHVLLFWLIGLVLHRQKIYIKV
jgi:predicted acyltransferase